MMREAVKGVIEFKEEQQFRQTWFWVLLIMPILSGVGIIIGLAISENKDALIGLAVVIPVNVVMLYLFFVTRFELIVTTEAVFYRWKPFNKKFREIKRADIAKVVVRKSPFLQLGYKKVIGYGSVHNLGAAKGLQFILQSGKKIFISSQKIKSFQRAVDELIPVSLK